MSYLSNNTRVSSLIVGGQDRTQDLVSWTVSDDSAYKNGCIVTTGQLVLGQKLGATSVSDYDRNAYKRGSVVTLDLVEPGGAPYRHPRGYLYVLSSSYDVQGEQLVLELGCVLALTALTEDQPGALDDLLALSPISLDVAQRTFSNISAAFASVGQFVYQDNQGSLQTGTYFDGDSTAGVASGQWASVLGVTTNDVSPLAGFEALPDRINLSYQVPSGVIASDERGKVDVVTDTSTYFVPFPATVYRKINTQEEESDLVKVTYSTTAASTTRVASQSACGNSPPPPTGVTVVRVSCSGSYATQTMEELIPATKTTITTTYYDAPGGQVSRVYAETFALGIEINQQYYADRFAYCSTLYSHKCQVNGDCRFEGITPTRMGYIETINEYGEANELVKTTTDTYVTRLSAANTVNWRAGLDQGYKRFIRDIDPTEMYRTERSVTEYYKEGNANVQLTTTWRSHARNGGGLNVPLDALEGVKTTQKRISVTTSTLELAPDRVNTSQTSTNERSTELLLGTAGYLTPPTQAGPYILEEQIPVPLLYDNRAEIDSAVELYSNYITRFVKGDIYGLSITEGMRSEVAQGWVPNMPFRYYDPKRQEMIALRMDATVWGVDGSGAAFATSGIWVGTSNGTVTIPSNVTGNSTPNMSATPVSKNPPSGAPSTPPTPPGPQVPPSIVDETYVNSGVMEFVVNVNLNFSAVMNILGESGIRPPLPKDGDLTTVNNLYFAAYISGLVVGPGDLLATDSTGSIPSDIEQGQLVVANATVIQADLFATTP